MSAEIIAVVQRATFILKRNCWRCGRQCWIDSETARVQREHKSPVQCVECIEKYSGRISGEGAGEIPLHFNLTRAARRKIIECKQATEPKP